MAPGWASSHVKRPAVRGHGWLGAKTTMRATPAMTRELPSTSRLRKGSLRHVVEMMLLAMMPTHPTAVTTLAGVGLDDNGMGQTVGDFDNDLRLDWYVTSIHKDNPFPGDTIGIIDENNTDEFFGVSDTINENNSGPLTATWVFDVAGADDLESRSGPDDGGGGRAPPHGQTQGLRMSDEQQDPKRTELLRQALVSIEQLQAKLDAQLAGLDTQLGRR